ncbi:MAG: GIY-YIG nuclease family protein [Patescibacteria group bacterium]|nr:GIY-YIG nuclease family protein [Patescibacteria group bacterium]
MSYFIYILECVDKSYYTGITNNLEKRMRQHNGELKGGAVYTRNKRPVKLVHKEEYSSHLEASRREIAIKKLSRINKEKLFLK